jgi:anaerobic selenocysteine-containing dehydrogenase
MSAPDEQTHHRTCPLCEGMCGLEIHVKNGRVDKIRPDFEDVWSQGYICPKGTTLGELYHDPDRLRAPLVKRDGDFVEVSWADAYAECERLLHGVLERHGRQALTAYIGNPTAHNFSLSRYVGAFMAFSQLGMIYSSGTVDQWPKNVSASLMYGGMWTIPTADIDHSDYLVIMGANPHASQGSLMCAPDFLGRMDALHARGGKTLVIDPRRTGTAKRASEWLAIQPGTDAALLLAVLNVLFDDGLAHLSEELAAHVHGFETVQRLVSDWTPERVASTCGIDATTIRRVAHEFARADRAAWYARIGTCNQEFGTLCSWLVDVVNIVTGNFDRRGGLMFANPAAWPTSGLPNPEWADGYEFGRWKSRVRGAPEVLGQVPASCLAEEIASPGEGQIKGLITIAGNPVLSLPGCEDLDAALPQLECMISLDNYLNETTRHADVILPGLAALEQPYYNDLLWCWSVRNAGRYSPVVFEPNPGTRAEWESLIMLGLLCAGQKAEQIDVEAVDRLYFAGIVGVVCGISGSPVEGRDPSEIVAQTPGTGPERLLDFQLRSGPYGDAYGANPDGLTLERMKASEKGIDFGALEPRLPDPLSTPSGKIELAPEYITNDLGRLQQRLGRDDGLVLVSRRHLRSNNSWMHNVPSLMSGKDRCTLLINPEDASRYGLEDGQLSRVSSAAGSLQVAVELSDDMMPGVVSLPHGWGHDKQGARLSVASRHAGVCNNILAPGDFVDAISGNAAVNGIPVEVAAV